MASPIELDRRLMRVRTLLDHLYEDATRSGEPRIAFAVSDAIDEVDTAIDRCRESQVAIPRKEQKDA